MLYVLDEPYLDEPYEDIGQKALVTYNTHDDHATMASCIMLKSMLPSCKRLIKRWMLRV